ncbi:MAG: FAD-dependent oxidoreductase [Pseudomonadales bacterium]|nr:FAD-binding dehydrogenase [Pseudomonadales bacterium]NIX06574.1 FAD-dependent oxidoreductase [Pseudomonadales bacterium]
MARSPTVIVIGGGNAALCAAISAAEQGASVRLVERAPEALAGGNSRFTAGAMRVTYDGVEDLRRLMPELTDAEIARTDFGSYPRDAFFDDMGRITHYRTDPELAETLIDSSLPTLLWMRDQGVRFLPLYGRQSFEVDGKVRFWGGLTVEAWGGGPGLVEKLTEIARGHGVDIAYSSRAVALEHDGRRVTGVRLQTQAGPQKMAGDAVVLASGGFESNAAWRARHLGAGWDLARVRGTRFNTGDGIQMALAIGAASRGHWSGCHAVAWDLNAPEYGDLDVGDGFQKHSYPLGILVNNRGQRFVDEGADFRNYTYARYGAEILAQPQQTAWQVFDAKVTGLLRDEYRIRTITRVVADSLESLAEKMEGVDAGGFLSNVKAFNQAVRTDVPFDPSVKDGRGTAGLDIPKSNWANPLDTAPFEAYGVTCGITFTFGGLHTDVRARVIDQGGEPIQGLFAAGELVGGLFYFNYPGGTGLTSGAVFGRIAGLEAAGSRSA